jgi:pimeloyl-ACP methyl ester carboxylesterase
VTTEPPTGPAPSTTAATGALIAGPPGAPAIVFIHGTRLTRTYWTPQLEALGGEFRTIAIDLPGHGSRAAEPFTLDGAADVVARAIETDAGGRAVVVGLSLGGYVAIALAARRPELVRGLVVSGATAEPAGMLTAGVLGLARALDLVARRRLDPVNAWFFRARYPAAIAEPVVAGGFWSTGGAAALRAIAGERFKPRLAAYPGPTLLINGAYDFVFRPGSRSFAAAARDARRVRLGGASHLANLDRPAAFSEAVRRFARSLDGA